MLPLFGFIAFALGLLLGHTSSALTPRFIKLTHLTQDAPQYVRIQLKDGRFLEGEWIGSHIHDYWKMDPPIKALLVEPQEVTQMLFRQELVAREPEKDRSLSFFSAKAIQQITPIPVPEGVPSYRDFLRKQQLCYRADFLGKGRFVPRIDSENYDPRDHLVENGEGLFAWDLYLTPRNSERIFRGQGRRNRDHFIWGSLVRFPMRGWFGPAHDRAWVAERVDGYRDFPVTESPPRAREGQENFLIANVYGNFQVVQAHLQQHSIPTSIRVGSLLSANSMVGRVGNSGWSDVPHLHTSLLWHDPVTQRQWSVPSEFCNLNVVREWSQAPQRFPYHIPARGDWILPEKAG